MSSDAVIVLDGVEVADALSSTVNGRLDCRAMCAAPRHPASDADTDARAKTSLEAALKHVVADVLPNGPEPMNATFLAAARDSILTTTTIARLRSLLRVTAITAIDFFTEPTIRQLAVRLATREDTQDQLEAIADIYLEVADVAEPAPQPRFA